MIFSHTTAGPQLGSQHHHDQMLYLMAKPSAELARRMDRLRRKHALAHGYDRARLHMTLVPFGDIRGLSEDELAQIRRVAASMHSEPFEVCFDQISGNALAGKGMASALHFQRELTRRLGASGLILPDYVFRPHVSLAYTEWQPRNIPIEPIRWTVDTFLLVNSVHGKGHELLDEWQLERRQGAFDF
jgi:RNA 2',3'-cyclic 3'-phosphodiesterase